MSKITLSIITVHYRATQELFDALKSIKNLKTLVSFEVIVIDNDEKVTIEKEIKKKFPWVNYIKSPRNGGFGAGNNLGAKHAKGEYLFFLNPDTVVYPQTLEALINFLQQHKEVGIVAPVLLDPQQKPYDLQGTTTLTPLAGAVALSFLNKLFPRNPISKKYWQTGWNKTQQKEVDVIPGTAFVISKKLYDKINGFDENFFLYFEEFDLCKRVRDLGYKIYIIPEAKVMHLWGRSTQYTKNINKIFISSRKYYFKKHYGPINAWIVEAFTTFNKERFALLLILLFGICIRVYKINALMPFIGDQGWFYLSARDSILTHKIPLVGITSSHPWLHQGPLWTYLLAIALFLGRWNPVAGAYLSISIGVIAIYMIYKVGTELFSEKLGIISALLFATSPLVVLTDRMPYHTAPIPLFTLLLIYALYKWLKGNTNALPWVFFFLTVLYNFELATAVLWLIPIILIPLTILKKKRSVSYKTIGLSILAAGVPMVPMLLYDLKHGFPQTIKFMAWIGYKILRIFGFPDIHFTTEKFNGVQFLNFTTIEYQRIIYANSLIISLILCAITTITFYTIIFNKIRKKQLEPNWLLVVILFTITIVGYMIEKTPSGAYIPMLIPGGILVTALAFEKLFQKLPKITSTLLLIILAGINTYTLIQNNYYLNKGGYGFSLTERENAVKKIIKVSQGQPYNLKGQGPGSQFSSFTMNYEYLTWYLGHPPTRNPQQIKIIVSENKDEINIDKRK